MGLTRLIRFIRGGSAKRKAQTASSARSRWQPTLERLEDRATPTALGGPVFYVFPTPLLVHVTVTGPLPGHITPSTTVSVAAPTAVVAHSFSMMSVSVL